MKSGIEKAYDIIRELRECGIDKKNIVNFIRFFSDKSYNIIENPVFKEGSVVKRYLMEKIGLGEDIIESLDKFILNKDFKEGKDLFNSLRDFFRVNYENIDLIVYKFNKIKKSLEYYAGNSNIEINSIDIESVKNNYINEYKALKDEKGYIFYSKTGVNYFGGLLSIKISLPWGEDLILSFNKKTNLYDEDYDNNLVDDDILKIRKLFQKHGLRDILKLILKNINLKYKDSLTGLFNRVYIEEALKTKKSSILFIDVNNFKYINDTYGHNVGDEVLKTLAQVLKSSVRESSNDKVCRKGGDEFIILASTNDLKTLETLEEKIHTNMKNTAFVCKIKGCSKNCNIKEQKSHCETELGIDNISVSIGKFLNNNSSISIEEILENADKDMLDKKGEKGTTFRALRVIPSLKEVESLELIIKARQERIKELTEKKEEN